jgi:hypothetical protein
VRVLDSGAKCNKALCELDLHVFPKLFEDCLKGVLKPRHFLGVRLAAMLSMSI